LIFYRFIEYLIYRFIDLIFPEQRDEDKLTLVDDPDYDQKMMRDLFNDTTAVHKSKLILLRNLFDNFIFL